MDSSNLRLAKVDLGQCSTDSEVSGYLPPTWALVKISDDMALARADDTPDRFYSNARHPQPLNTRTAGEKFIWRTPYQLLLLKN